MSKYETINYPFAAADVLDIAADILDTNGWCRWASTNDQGHHCATGAIDAVDCLNEYKRLAEQALAEEIDIEVARSHWSANTNRRVAIMTFNDQQDRNGKRTVTRRLRKTARQLRNQKAGK